MSQEGKGEQITILSVSKRRGAGSDRGCRIAIKYRFDGDSDEHIDWLDRFIEQYCDNVTVLSNGWSNNLN